MLDQKLNPRSALETARRAGRSGVEIEVVDNLTIALIAARNGQAAGLGAQIRDQYSTELPSSPRLTSGRGTDFLWAGPSQWLAIAPRENGRDLETELAPKLAGLAAVTDQSDARAVLRVSGPRARDTLAKGLPLDLHPRVFPAGSVAITHAAHIGTLIWRPLGQDGFMLACPRSYAASFWHWLTDSAAEFGSSIA